MDPIDYPTVTIGERTLVVRYSFAAQILLVRGGLDPLQLGKLLANTEPRHKEYWIRVFAACVAENYLDLSRPEECTFRNAPTADYWMSQLDLMDVAEVIHAVGVSMGKVVEALKMKRERKPPIQIAS